MTTHNDSIWPNILVHEHQDFLVINKPAGIPVHRESEQSPGILEYLPKGDYFLCHRLDRETSGLLLIAKHKTSAAELSQLFAKKEVQKFYLAVCDRKPKKSQGKIAGDMEKARNGSWKLARSMNNPAVTYFFSKGLPAQVSETSDQTNDGMTQKPALRGIILKPVTGKTHQLRVALASLSAPILGDTRYKGSKSDRLYLHAYSLSFNYQNELFQFKQIPTAGSLFDTFFHSDNAQWLEPEQLGWPG